MKRIRVHTLTDGRDCEAGTFKSFCSASMSGMTALEMQEVNDQVPTGAICCERSLPDANRLQNGA